MEASPHVNSSNCKPHLVQLPAIVQSRHYLSRHSPPFGPRLVITRSSAFLDSTPSSLARCCAVRRYGAESLVLVLPLLRIQKIEARARSSSRRRSLSIYRVRAHISSHSHHPYTTAKLSDNQDAAQAARKSPDLHRPIMQSMPDTRQQSFDEIYGPPENFLEIEVRKIGQQHSIVVSWHGFDTANGG